MGVKKSLVRLIFYSILIFNVTLNSSCDKNVEETLIDFVIFNESGVDLRITPHEDSNFRTTKSSFSIANNAGFSERITRNERFDRDNTFSTFFGTDSISIIFGNQREKTFSCLNNSDTNCADNRNILRFRADENNRAEFTFTISDFDAAELCDGNCN